MSDWSAGYVADIGYTYGYYTELNPMRVKLAFLNAGLTPPTIGAACELGFGQGVSVNMHAAASVIEWHGTDFNPSQANFAQELSQASGAQAHLYDDAFADFAKRPELPQFDYIGIHGIWSWISDENRHVLVEFIRQKLKVGGVLYISYNTLPGWATFAPMRHLLTEHAQVMGAQGVGIINRIDGAIQFADRFLETKPSYANLNPSVIGRVETLKGQNRHYLAHEYFNRDWHPMYYADMAEWLAPAKLQFACSAQYSEHIENINFSPEQRALLAEITDNDFRQTVKDFMVNQQFRKDYWVKGVRNINPVERAEKLRALSVLLVIHPDDISLKFSTALGEANMNADIYQPIIQFLSDHKVHTLAQVEQAMSEKGIALAHIIEAIMLLTHAGYVMAVQDKEVSKKAQKQVDAINQHAMTRARANTDLSYLASAVTGGAIGANRFEQLFMLAYKQGMKQPSEWAAMVWQILNAQSQKIVKDGKPLENDEDNLAEITRQAEVFAQKRLAIMKALAII